MKFKEDRPFATPEAAERKLLELANAIDAGRLPDSCMEVTALRDQAEIVQHFADRIFRRAWRPLWPRGNDPNLG